MLELRLIEARLDIEKEIYTTIKNVPGSIAVLSKLGALTNLLC